MSNGLSWGCRSLLDGDVVNAVTTSLSCESAVINSGLISGATGCMAGNLRTQMTPHSRKSASWALREALETAAGGFQQCIGN